MLYRIYKGYFNFNTLQQFSQTVRWGYLKAESYIDLHTRHSRIHCTFLISKFYLFLPAISGRQTEFKHNTRVHGVSLLLILITMITLHKSTHGTILISKFYLFLPAISGRQTEFKHYTRVHGVSLLLISPSPSP